jgi:ABC-type sugar transport system ATPase subunit
MNQAIELDAVSAVRDGRAVLHQVSLTVARGEVVAVVGPSGAGKSTLLRIVLGLTPPASGLVRLVGVVVSAGERVIVPPEERNLGMVFQDLALWPHLTVHGNLAFGLESRRIERSERERRIETWLRRLGLLDKRDRRPGSLSGGERQRLALARALVLEPPAILLDEPLASLDVLLRREVLDLLREVLAEQAVSAVYVTHDPREAVRIAKRLIVMEAGRVVQAGDPVELRERPANAFVEALLAETS